MQLSRRIARTGLLWHEVLREGLSLHQALPILNHLVDCRYNFHPGSTCGKWSTEDGIAQIAALVNRALAATSGVTIVLENTAGQGSCIGHRFEQLADIIAQVRAAISQHHGRPQQAEFLQHFMLIQCSFMALACCAHHRRLGLPRK